MGEHLCKYMGVYLNGILGAVLIGTAILGLSCLKNGKKKKEKED